MHFMMPDSVPCRSGLLHICPSDQSDNARSSCTFGCEGSVCVRQRQPGRIEAAGFATHGDQHPFRFIGQEA